MDLGVVPIANKRATRTEAGSPYTEQVVRLEGWGFAGEGTEQTLILFHNYSRTQNGSFLKFQGL
jgi:hypothetical protein